MRSIQPQPKCKTVMKRVVKTANEIYGELGPARRLTIAAL